MKKLELIYPLNSSIIKQEFGDISLVSYYKKNGVDIIGHNGIDFKAWHGESVYATHDGIVYIGVDDREGHGVVIRTIEPFYYDGVVDCYYKTVYWHLLPNIVVKDGQKVECGDLIGYADNTGLSTGDHLHFGLKPQLLNESNKVWYNVEQKNGYLGAINPMPFFNNYHPKDIEDLKKQFSLLQKFLNYLKSFF